MNSIKEFSLLAVQDRETIEEILFLFSAYQDAVRIINEFKNLDDATKTAIRQNLSVENNESELLEASNAYAQGAIPTFLKLISQFSSAQNKPVKNDDSQDEKVVLDEKEEEPVAKKNKTVTPAYNKKRKRASEGKKPQDQVEEQISEKRESKRRKKERKEEVNEKRSHNSPRKK